MNELVENVVADEESEENEHRDEYLAFTLESNIYAVDILRVQEIRGWQNVTRVPNTPKYVTGVLNMRGAIVPILDLREKFDFSVTEYTPLHVIIVLSIFEDDHEKIVGVIVDSVQDVIAVAESEIQPPPVVRHGDKPDYIGGLTSVKSKMVTILDIDRLIALPKEQEQVD